MNPTTDQPQTQPPTPQPPLPPTPVPMQPPVQAATVPTQPSTPTVPVATTLPISQPAMPSVPTTPQQATQPQQIPQPQANTQPYKQSQVTMIGVTRLSPRKPALLEWSADNRIRLFELDPTGQQIIATHLDCMPQEIQKFSIATGVVTIKTVRGSFHVDFSNDSNAKIFGTQAASTALRMVSPLGGLIGDIATTAASNNAVKQEAQTDLAWWTQNLGAVSKNAGGVSSKFFLRLDILGWIVLGVIILVLIIAALVS